MRASYRVVATRKSDGFILSDETATDHYAQGMGAVGNNIRAKLILSHPEAKDLTQADIEINMNSLS